MRVRGVSVVLVLFCAVFAISADARAGGIGTTVDGRYAMTGRLGAGSELDVEVLGRGGVPASGVSAVELNVTATEPTQSSFVSVWPTGQPRPLSSTVNFVAGQTLANVNVVAVGTGGDVSLFNYAGDVHLVVDVIGWTPTGGALNTVTPTRLADTRAGYATVDGTTTTADPLSGGETRAFRVAGRGGIPTAGAGAVLVNLTATDPTAAGYLTVTPTGSRPASSLTSNINFVAGQTVANMAIVPIGPDGQIDVHNYAGDTDVIIDVLGYITTTSGAIFQPARAIDTRPGAPTTDGAQAGGGPLGAGASREVAIAGRFGIPANAAAVAVNLTAVNATTTTYLTLWPTGTPQPVTSNLNVASTDPVASTAIVKLGANGAITIANYAGTTDLVVDVLGWLSPDGTFNGLDPARLVDTRPTPSTPPATCALTGTSRRGESLGGNTRYDVTVTNQGAPCDVSGYPTVFGVDRNGVAHDLDALDDGTYFGGPGSGGLASPPAIGALAPGQVGDVIVAGIHTCDAANEGHNVTWPTLRLAFASGATVDATPADNQPFDSTCGTSVSMLGPPVATG
jgi:hypothetical protein